MCIFVAAANNAFGFPRPEKRLFFKVQKNRYSRISRRWMFDTRFNSANPQVPPIHSSVSAEYILSFTSIGRITCKNTRMNFPPNLCLPNEWQASLYFTSSRNPFAVKPCSSALRESVSAFKTRASFRTARPGHFELFEKRA